MRIKTRIWHVSQIPTCQLFLELFNISVFQNHETKAVPSPFSRRAIRELHGEDNTITCVYVQIAFIFRVCMCEGRSRGNIPAAECAIASRGNGIKYSAVRTCVFC